MHKKNPQAELKLMIQILELDHTKKGQLLKDQINITYQSLKPANLIRSTLKDISSTPYLMDNVIDAALGLITGYFSKNMITGKSDSVFKKIFGTVIQFGVTNIVAQNAEIIKCFGQSILQTIFAKKKST